MPDWCENKLYVIGNASNVSKFSRTLQSDVKRMHKTVAPKRKTGRCVYWNEDRGFGFLKSDEADYATRDVYEPEEEYGDIFVHCSQLHANGRPILQKGECVEFDLVVQNEDRKKAINVTGPNGRYVAGNYDFYKSSFRGDGRNGSPYVLKLECYGFKEVPVGPDAHDSIKESKNKPDLNRMAKSRSRLSEIQSSASLGFMFSTKFTPPIAWMESVTRLHSVSLHLTYGAENPERSGFITAEKGKVKEHFSVEHYELFQDNMDVFQTLFQEGAQRIFANAVCQALSADIVPSIIDIILSFSPQYQLQGLSKLFYEVKSKYQTGKGDTVPEDCLLFEIFSSIEKQLEMVFVEEHLEIMNRRYLSCEFWDIFQDRALEESWIDTSKA